MTDKGRDSVAHQVFCVLATLCFLVGMGSCWYGVIGQEDVGRYEEVAVLRYQLWCLGGFGLEAASLLLFALGVIIKRLSRKAEEPPAIPFDWPEDSGAEKC